MLELLQFLTIMQWEVLAQENQKIRRVYERWKLCNFVTDGVKNQPTPTAEVFRTNRISRLEGNIQRRQYRKGCTTTPQYKKR